MATAALAALAASTGTGFAQFQPYGDPDEGPGVRFGGGYADEAFVGPDIRRERRLERLRRERLREIYGRPVGRGFDERGPRGFEEGRGDERGRPAFRGRGDDGRFGRGDDEDAGRQGGQRQRMQRQDGRDQADREPGDGGRGQQSGRQAGPRRQNPGQNQIPPEAMDR